MLPSHVTALAIVAYLALRYLIQPPLRRRLAQSGGKPDLIWVGYLGIAESITTLVLLMAISSGLVALALLGLDVWTSLTKSTVNLASIDELLKTLRYLQHQISSLHSGFVIALFLLLVLGIGYSGLRGRRTQVAGLIEKERRAQFDTLMEKARAGELEPIEPTDDMKRILDMVRETDDHNHNFLSECLNRDNGELSMEERRAVDEVINRRNELVNAFAYVDISRRVDVKIDTAQFQHTRVPGFGAAIGTFFISRGLLSAFSSSAKVTFVAACLLFVPASLVVVGASEGTQDNIAVTLADVEGLRISLGHQESAEVFAKAAVAAEAAGQQSAEAPAEIAQVSPVSQNWCSASGEVCDSVALARLSSAFEQAYARNLYGRMGVRADVSNAQSQKVVLKAILNEVSQRPVASGTGFVDPSGRPAGQVRIDDQVLAERLAAIDPKFDNPLRERFKDFVSAELVQKRPGTWKKLKVALAGHGSAFGELPLRVAMQQGLVLRAVGAGLATVVGAPGDLNLSYDKVFLTPTARIQVHDSSFNLQARVYTAELLRTGDPAMAEERIKALSHLDAGFRQYEIAELQRISPRINAISRNAESLLDTRPATLTRMRDVIDTKRIDTLIATLPESQRRAALETKLGGGYDDIFAPRRGPSNPGPIVAIGPGPRPNPSPYSFNRMNSFSKVGGIVFGRPPENPDATVDFRDIGWHQTRSGLTLVLTPADGRAVVLGPFRSEIVQLALGYVADGRLVPVTVLNARPLSDQQVVMHPMLLDTALGCRFLAMDFYVFDLTAKDEMVRRSMTRVTNVEALYRLAWIERAEAMLQNLKSDEARGFKWPVNGDVLDETIRAWQLDLPSEADLGRILADPEFRLALKFVDAKPEYFDPNLAATLRTCTSTLRDSAAVKACFRERGAAFVSAAKNEIVLPPGFGGTGSAPKIDAELMLRALTPIPKYGLVSGVREAKWRLDPALAFAASADAAGANQSEAAADRPLGASSVLEFSIQAAFETKPYFKEGVEKWWQEGDKPKLDGAFDEEPWIFPDIAERVHEAVGTIRTNPVRQDELGPVEEFARLQRLFRAAVQGRLGPLFPTNKLVTLAHETANAVTVSRTPRWKSRPGAIEAGFFYWVRKTMEDLSVTTEKSRSRAQACFAIANVNEDTLPTQWPTQEIEASFAPAAKIAPEAWTQACVFEAADFETEAGRNFSAVSASVAKLRELRSALSLGAADEDARLGPAGHGVCAPM